MPNKDPEKHRENRRRWAAAHPDNARKRDHERYTKNTEKAKAYGRKYREAHPEILHGQHFKRVYGITREDYAAMVAEQGGRCAICGRGDVQLCVDHNHATSVVRGLLCRKCNGGIGLLGDNPDLTERATAYLLGLG